MAKKYDKTEEAVYVTATLKDFDGDVEKWKHAFYELWRYQMGWSFAHVLEVIEGRTNGVFIRAIIKPSFKDPLLSTMETLGYRNVQTDDTHIGVIEDWGDLGDIEVIVVE